MEKQWSRNSFVISPHPMDFLSYCNCFDLTSENFLTLSVFLFNSDFLFVFGNSYCFRCMTNIFSYTSLSAITLVTNTLGQTCQLELIFCTIHQLCITKVGLSIHKLTLTNEKKKIFLEIFPPFFKYLLNDL